MTVWPSQVASHVRKTREHATWPLTIWGPFCFYRNKTPDHTRAHSGGETRANIVANSLSNMLAMPTYVSSRIEEFEGIFTTEITIKVLLTHEELQWYLEQEYRRAIRSKSRG